MRESLLAVSDNKSVVMTGRFWFWAGFQFIAAGAIVFLASNVRLGSPVWKLDSSLRIYVGSLALAYLLSAALLSWRLLWNLDVGLKDVFVAVSMAYAICGLGLFVVPYGPYSRSVFVTALAAAYALALLPVILKYRVGRFAALVLLIATAVLSLIYRSYSRDTDSSLAPQKKFETTALYNVALTIHHDVAPSPIQGGGMRAFGTGFLIANGNGALYYFERPEETPFTVRTLPYSIPINHDEFLSDKADTVPDAFRVADIMIQENGPEFRLFASHHYWNRQGQCYVLRVSEIHGERGSFLQGKADLQWQTVYDTRPCLPLHSTRMLFAGFQVGGRMAQLDERTILLTVGDGEFDGWNSKLDLPQDPKADWGKTLRIDTSSGAATIYTSGHRNAQGLTVMPNGHIWLTEHGPRGGDELNLLYEGANYGWPLVTYGTEYGTLVWPLSKDQGRHSGFKPPVHAWVPSIGVSSLIGLQKDRFNLWRGDLLAGSLRDRTLYRIRIEDDHVAYVEPIMKIGLPIRDLAEGQDGRVALMFDGGDIGVLEPIAVGDNGATAKAQDLDALLLGQCKGCHPIGDGSTHGIGPDLRGVVGRPVASAPGFAYSEALTKLSGRWTPERLDAFLHDPASYAPGTSMQSDVLPDEAARKKLIEYLATLR